MGRCVIKQPDGLYAVFSTGTDRWIATDMTRDQYIEWRGRPQREDGSIMIIGRDRRVARWFWKAETTRHRWSIRIHFWLHRANWLRLNRQPRFTEIMVARCVVFCHSRLGGWAAGGEQP